MGIWGGIEKIIETGEGYENGRRGEEGGHKKGENGKLVKEKKLLCKKKNSQKQYQHFSIFEKTICDIDFI